MTIENGTITHINVMPAPIAAPAASKILPALFAGLFGLALLFAAGFAEIKPLHSATHDTRHSTGFPCH